MYKCLNSSAITSARLSSKRWRRLWAKPITYASGPPTTRVTTTVMRVSPVTSISCRTSSSTRASVRPPERRGHWDRAAGGPPTLLLLGRLGGFSCLWRGFYSRDALEGGGQQPPRLSVGLALGVQLLPEVLDLAGEGVDQGVRPVDRSANARSCPVADGLRPVGGFAGGGFAEDDVDRPAFPDGVQGAALDTAPHSFSGDAKDFRSLSHGQPPPGRLRPSARSVTLSHTPMLGPYRTPRKPSEGPSSASGRVTS
jgi:hypothetical protein